MDRKTPHVHDRASCRCLQDEEAIKQLRSMGAANDTPMPDPACGCPCRQCVARKVRHDGVVRRGRLELRLAKAGIGMADLADLVWGHVEDGLEEWVRKTVARTLREKLSKLRIRLGSIHIDQATIKELE